MAIYTVGYDSRLIYAKGMLEERLSVCAASVYLLPIPTTRDGEHITGTATVLSQYLKKLESGDALVCYGLPLGMAEGLAARGVRVIELSRDEEYLAEGAYLTAVGAVGYLLRGSGRAPADMRVGVVGIGRIGRRLAEMLIALGYHTVAFSSGSCDSLRALGAQVLDYGALRSGEFDALDILINTAPAKILPWVPDALRCAQVIELASGENLPRELPCVRLASLPARAFPDSAGYSVARAVLRKLTPPKI